MSSRSLQRWEGEKADALDEIENAHASVGGTERGRRYATQQINLAYAALLSSQFQGFCRDLHSECVEHVVAATPAGLQTLLRAQFYWARALDRGNPSPGNIGSDFGRFGIRLWTRVHADYRQNDRRQELLQELNDWRNAIAHQDFDPDRLGGTTTLHLAKVRGWRTALNRLARSFDAVMALHLQIMLGAAPW
jgi:hypothetical protein